MRLSAGATGRALPAAARAVARVRSVPRARVMHVAALYRPDGDPTEARHTSFPAGVSSAAARIPAGVSSAAAGKRALWVDCDAGIDDAQGAGFCWLRV
jgi:hypothetical protein